jgi:transcription initiation factor TFIID TATA-box-binding protein
VVRELKAKGIPVRSKPSIEIQNIVASADLGGKVDQEKAVYILERCMYEPEVFPGAIYRMLELKVVILIFASGKLVVAGAKTEEQVYEATERLQQRLEDEGLIFYE